MHSLLVTRCKITRYSLQNSLITRCKKSLVTRCKIRSLLVAEAARCKKSLVTRCRSCSLQKITRYSLQNITYSLQKWSQFLQLHEKVTPAKMFSCEFLRKFENTYSVEHLRTAASENNIKTSTNFLQFFTSIKFFTLI